jgi:hypothetical protein
MSQKVTIFVLNVLRLFFNELQDHNLHAQVLRTVRYYLLIFMEVGFILLLIVSSAVLPP